MNAVFEWNGVRVRGGAKVQLPGMLRAIVPDCPSVWISVDYDVGYPADYSSKGIFDIALQKPGDHLVRIFDNAYSGKEGVIFGVTVLPAKVEAGKDEIPSKPVTMQANTQEALIGAIAAGAQVIETTTGLKLSQIIDARGVTIRFLPTADNKAGACIELIDGGGLKNAHLDPDRRKAIVSSGKLTLVENVTWGERVNNCLHVTAGNCSWTNCRTADTFWGYGVYLEPGTYILAKGGFIGSSHDESSWRSNAGRFDREGLTIDATRSKTAGAKNTADRGDAPAWPDGRPGGNTVACSFTGLVGPNPLDGWDATGDCIDRFKLANGWTVQIKPGEPRVEQAKQLARKLYAAGASITDIAKACWKLAMTEERHKLSEVMTDADAAAAAAERARVMAKTSLVIYADCTLKGQLRLAARATVRIVGGSVDSGTLPLFAGNSTPHHPDPALVIVHTEAGAPPAWTFERVEIKCNGLGASGKDYPGVTINGKALA